MAGTVDLCIMIIKHMKKIFFLIPILTGYLAVCGQSTRQQLPAARHTFTVIAHRGDHVEAPENTLAAFQLGIDHGVDYVELDLRTTKDSQLVIMHDNTVNRTTDGSGTVSDLTFKEIRQLKIKDPWHPGKTLQVPTFREALDLCKKGRIHIYLDFKAADVKAAWDVIRAAGMEKEILVYINSTSQYRQWQEVVPDMPLMVSLPEEVKDAAALVGFLEHIQIAALDGDFRKYNREMVDAATKMGVAVWPDIQHRNEGPVLWEQALEKGLQGVQTDHPAALINYLQLKKLRIGR